MFSLQVCPLSTKSGSQLLDSSAVRTFRALNPGRNPLVGWRFPTRAPDAPHNQGGALADAEDWLPLTVPGATETPYCSVASRFPAFPLPSSDLEGAGEAMPVIIVESRKGKDS